MDINNFRQNHPELIVKDIIGEGRLTVPDVREILKYRGVNKWFRVRKLLIQLKLRWLDSIKELELAKKEAKAKGDIKQFYKLKGYIEALVDCRQQVRALCHSPRDIDFPEDPKKWGDACELPKNFPKRPKKRWFCKYKTFNSENYKKYRDETRLFA